MPIRHCQGCGAEDGGKSRDFRAALFGPPVKLVPMILADYGERLLCQECHEGAVKLNTRLRTARLTHVYD
ncbi:MAG: hypothetical protein ACREJ5_04330 [Geminicoccaceae bacterium]